MVRRWNSSETLSQHAVDINCTDVHRGIDLCQRTIEKDRSRPLKKMQTTLSPVIRVSRTPVSLIFLNFLKHRTYSINKHFMKTFTSQSEYPFYGFEMLLQRFYSVKGKRIFWNPNTDILNKTYDDLFEYVILTMLGTMGVGSIQR